MPSKPTSGRPEDVVKESAASGGENAEEPCSTGKKRQQRPEDAKLERERSRAGEGPGKTEAHPRSPATPRHHRGKLDPGERTEQRGGAPPKDEKGRHEGEGKPGDSKDRQQDRQQEGRQCEQDEAANDKRAGQQPSGSGVEGAPGKRAPLVVPPLPRVLNRPYPLENKSRNSANAGGSSAAAATDVRGGGASTASGSKTATAGSKTKPGASSAGPFSELAASDARAAGSSSVSASASGSAKDGTTAAGTGAKAGATVSKKWVGPHPRAFGRRGKAAAGEPVDPSAGSDKNPANPAEGGVTNRHRRSSSVGTVELRSQAARAALPSSALGPKEPTSLGRSHSERASVPGSDVQKPHGQQQEQQPSTCGHGGSGKGASSAGGGPGSARSLSLHFFGSGKAVGSRRVDGGDEYGDFPPGGPASKNRGALGVARMCAVLSASWRRRRLSKQRHGSPPPQGGGETPAGRGDEPVPGRVGRRVFDDEGIHLNLDLKHRGGVGIGITKDSDKGTAQSGAASGHGEGAGSAVPGRKSGGHEGSSSGVTGRGGKATKARKPSASSSSSAATAAASIESNRGFQAWLDSDSRATKEFNTNEASFSGACAYTRALSLFVTPTHSHTVDEASAGLCGWHKRGTAPSFSITRAIALRDLTRAYRAWPAGEYPTPRIFEGGPRGIGNFSK